MMQQKHDPDQQKNGQSDPASPDLANAATSIISLHILEILASGNDDHGVTELAAMLDIPKARAHRHLVTLRQSGYVTQNPETSRYRIGWRLYLFGQQLVARFNIGTLAKPIMRELSAQFGHTIVISTFDQDTMVVLDVERGQSPMQILLAPGTRYPFQAVAQGKIMLAFGPETLNDKVLVKPLQATTAHTIIDADRLRAEIALVRQRGWAEAPEELFIGVNALAAPVFNADGSLFGALAIVGSIHYLPAQADMSMVNALMHAAARVSEALGARIDPATLRP